MIGRDSFLNGGQVICWLASRLPLLIARLILDMCSNRFVNAVECWLQREKFFGRRKASGEIKIICIEKRNVLEPAFQNAQVPARARATIGPVRMTVEANGRVFFGQLHAYRKAAVR